MNLQCPYRNIPYSAWRLDVLRTLFQFPEKARRRTYVHTARPNRSTCRRNYSDSQTPTQRTQVLDVQHEAHAESSTAGEKSRGNAGPTPPFNPYSDAGLQAVKDLLAELQAVSKKVHHGDADKKCGTDFKPVVFEPPAEPGTKRKTYKRIALDTSTEHRPPISKSPVVRWVQKVESRRTEEKIHPSYHHIRGLKNNPWAEILASPIRACQGSGARLPVDLLLDLGYVKNPKDDKIYLLPTRLADVDALDAKMASELRASQRLPAVVAPQVEQPSKDIEETGRNSPGEPTPRDNSPSETRKPPQPQSRLFPNHTFLAYITAGLTRPVKKTFKFPSATGRESLPGEIGKLVHFEAREAFSTAQHYLQNKQRFVSGHSGTRDTPSSNLEKGTFNLNKLQWQVELPSRIVHIMRRRILVALNALARSESAAKSQDALPGRPSGVIPLLFPKNGTLNGDELRPQGSTAEVNYSPTTETAKSVSKIRRVGSKTTGPEVTTPSETASSTSPSHDPSPQSSQPSSPSFAAAAPSESTYHRLGHHEWLPGSIFLHVGARDISSLLSSTSSASSLPALPTDNPLLPPMLPVMDMHRFPVFSLDRLFSHTPVAPSAQQTADLKELLARPIFQPAHAKHADPNREGDNLLFVRSLQGPAKTVIEEVWRLWRYLGGENMDVSFFEDHDIDAWPSSRIEVMKRSSDRDPLGR